MDWKDALTQAQTRIEDYVEKEKAPAGHFFALHGASLEAGALETKHKELMALAIGISKQCMDCIAFHTKGAMDAGATRKDIEETVSVCVLMGGGPAVVYGTRALEAFDQFQAG